MKEKVKLSDRLKNAMDYRLSFIDWLVYTIMFVLISISVLLFAIMIMFLICPVGHHHNSIDSESTISKSIDDGNGESINLIDSTIPDTQSDSDSSSYIDVPKSYNVYVKGGGSIHIDPDMIIIDYNGRSETLTNILKLKDEDTSSSQYQTLTSPYLENGQKCTIEGEFKSSSTTSNGMYFSTQYMCDQGHWKELIPQ